MFSPVLGVGVLTALLVAQANDVIPSERAKEHLNLIRTVQMVVQSSRNVPSSEVYFLNSEMDYRHPSNLAIVIEYANARGFRQAGIEDPAQYYRGKTIQVTGTVILEREQVRIRVTEPEQIAVLDSRRVGRSRSTLPPIPERP